MKKGLVSSGPSLWILRWSQGLLPPSMRERERAPEMPVSDLLEGPRVCSEAEEEVEHGVESLEFSFGEGIC